MSQLSASSEQTPGQDVPEQDRAEKAMRRSEAKWRSVVSSVPCFVAVVDRDLRMEYLNRAAPGDSVADAIGKSVLSFLQPEYAGSARACLERVFRTGEAAHYEVVGSGPRSELSWYETYAGPVIADGEIVAATLVSTDISDRKRAEQERTESERRLATLLANLPGMAYRCRNDSHWTMEFVSEGCFPLTGYQPAELVGNRRVGYDEIIHPEDRSRVRAEVQLGIAQRRQFQLTYRIRTSQGEQKCVWEQGVAICSDDGQVVALEGFITDITDRKRLEAELRLSHDQLEQRVRDRTAELQSIYDGMVDGLLIADIQTQRFVQGNAAAARMLGYDVAEIPSLSVVEIHPADQLPWILERFGEHAAGRTAPSLDMPYRRKDGSVFYADVSTSRIMYQDRPCLMGFLRDVTERRQAEEDLRREKETLRRLLLASDHERRVIAYEIHDTIAQQLAGATLHLDGYLQSKETHPDRATKAFDVGLHALRACQTDIRRLIAGVRPMNLDDTGVEAAIRYLIRSLDGEPGPAIEFHCEVQFQRLESVQENAICRIVQEGLRNARKHSHSPSVRIELRQHGDRIRLVVQDWGTGFDPAEIGEYHFGLDAIRERARLLGGHAQIESRLGEGTCITVDMPLLAREDDE